MTLDYLKSHIVEELEGALDYMEKAIEHKGTEWGAKFYRMSEMELEHVHCLTKMFNSTEKSDNVSDSSYIAMQKAILDAYTASMGKYEALKKLYWKE